MLNLLRGSDTSFLLRKRIYENTGGFVTCFKVGKGMNASPMETKPEHVSTCRRVEMNPNQLQTCPSASQTRAKPPKAAAHPGERNLQ